MVYLERDNNKVWKIHMNISYFEISASLLHICFQCTLSLLSENIRKPYGFLMFSGDRERVHLKQIR